MISNPPFGSFSPLRQGSFGGSLPPSQSQTVFRMAWRTLRTKEKPMIRVLQILKRSFASTVVQSDLKYEDLLVLTIQVPDKNILLFAYSLAQRLSEGHLSKILQRGIDCIPDGLVEHRLHTTHQNLHGTRHRITVIHSCIHYLYRLSFLQLITFCPKFSFYAVGLR